MDSLIHGLSGMGYILVSSLFISLLNLYVLVEFLRKSTHE